MRDAACKGMHPHKHQGPDIFFPEKGGSRNAERAKGVCLDCPVFDKCREYTDRINPDYGIWAADHKSRW